MLNKQKEMEDRIFDKYESLILSRQQVAKVLKKSITTIDRWRKKGLYLEYSKNGDSKNATVEYSIDAIARYVISNKIKVS